MFGWYWLADACQEAGITAQTTLLANRQTLANLRTEQMTAAVQLIEASGGGWNVAQLAPKKSGGE